jgi:hypothetical protein
MTIPPPTTTDTVLCEVCGSPMEFHRYHDQAGCGSAVLALWRCPNGHVEYGDVIDYVTCDVDPDQPDA